MIGMPNRQRARSKCTGQPTQVYHHRCAMGVSPEGTQAVLFPKITSYKTPGMSVLEPTPATMRLWWYTCNGMIMIRACGKAVG